MVLLFQKSLQYIVVKLPIFKVININKSVIAVQCNLNEVKHNDLNIKAVSWLFASVFVQTHNWDL